MKKLMALFLVFVALITTAACDSYEKSPEVKSVHEESIFYLSDKDMMEFKKGAVFNSKWMEDNFKESYIIFEDDGDYEMYLLLIQNTDIAQQNKWYYVQVLGGDFVEAKEVSWSWAVTITTKLANWGHTDKIDKAWSFK